VDARRAGWPELLEHRRAVKTEAAHRAELRDRQEAARAAEQERADRAAEEQAERAWRPEGARMWLVLGGAGLLLALLLGWQARGLLRRLGGACETGH
jgi:Flp pilus assembly protein TadB